VFINQENRDFNAMVLVYLRGCGMPKAELARNIGVTAQHLHALLSERVEWKLKHALRAMRALGFTPESFYEELWKDEAGIRGEIWPT